MNPTSLWIHRFFLHAVSWKTSVPKINRKSTISASLAQRQFKLAMAIHGVMVFGPLIEWIGGGVHESHKRNERLVMQDHCDCNKLCIVTTISVKCYFLLINLFSYLKSNYIRSFLWPEFSKNGRVPDIRTRRNAFGRSYCVFGLRLITV